MFIVVSYDIASATSGNKVRKICEKYLHRVQKSVFEGDTSEKKLHIIKDKLASSVDPTTDSVIIYRFHPTGVPERETIGMIPASNDEFI